MYGMKNSKAFIAKSGPMLQDVDKNMLRVCFLKMENYTPKYVQSAKLLIKIRTRLIIEYM